MIYKNPVSNRAAVNIMLRDFARIRKLVSERPHFDSQWHLNFLAVRPDLQGRGIGSSIVKWGVNMAKEESIPCALEASRAGKRCYEKCGFIEIDVCDPFHGDPWEDGMHCQDKSCGYGGGTVMVWEPEDWADT